MSLTTLNYPDVRERVRADDVRKWDQTVPPEELRFQDGRMTFQRLYRAEYPSGLSLTPWAAGQMCQRLGIPAAYFRKCPAALQDINVNHWLQETVARRRGRSAAPDRWFLRARGETLRGMLSERYDRLDNADLLTTLEPLWESRFEVGWFAITDESLHLRVVDPRLSREVLPGDRLIAGLHIANSEVGKRSVTVDALAYRLVCSNGLVRLVKGRSLLSQRHVALTRTEFALALRDAVQKALAGGEGFLERLVWATEQPVREMDRTLTRLSERWRLSQTTQALVRHAILSERGGQQETLYGLVNGLTSAAQQLGADDRYTLETLAGTLLDTCVTQRDALPLPSPEDVAVELPPSPFTQEEEETIPGKETGTSEHPEGHRHRNGNANGPTGEPTPIGPVSVQS